MRAILLCLLAPAALAQTPSITVSWSPPTTYTDGSAIPSSTVMSYDVYEYLASNWAKIGSSASTNYVVTSGLVVGSTYTFYVIAIPAGANASAPSAQASGTVKPVSVPLKTSSPPTGVTAK
jgi:hypothetical protein